jgi:hypothetical protein
VARLSLGPPLPQIDHASTPSLPDSPRPRRSDTDHGPRRAHLAAVLRGR